MYLDIQKDPNRDGKWTLFIFLLAIAFMMLCATCEGQNCRQKGKVFPCDGLEYPDFYVNIYCDSISRGEYEFNLYLYLNDFTKDSLEVRLHFIDGSKDVLFPAGIEEENGYAEFKVYPLQVRNLYYNECVGIEIITKKIQYYFFPPERFFSSFISSL